MAITPTYPGVYIEELPSLARPIAGVATSITAFVGYTSRGIDNRAELILSFSDYERQFGGIAADSELSYAVQQFFANGGSQAYVVRAPRVDAKGSSVTFDNIKFAALSSGDWSDGKLLIDVDFNGVDRTKAFNLTVTNLDDGTVETFPSLSVDSTLSNYLVGVVNDPDNGSQLVNATALGALSAIPAITGTVGTTITSFDVTSAIGGTVLSGTIALTTGSASVTGTGTHFTTDLQAGQSLVFGADTSHTIYQIAAVANDTSLTLTTPYSGTAAPNSPITRWSTTALKDYGLVLSVSQPTTIPKPLPLTIRVFAKDGPIPQTVAGLAAQLERTINAALAVQWPGASVRCSVDTQTSGTTTTWAIRVNGLLPSLPTAILSDAGTELRSSPITAGRCRRGTRTEHAGRQQCRPLHPGQRECIWQSNRVGRGQSRQRAARGDPADRRRTRLHRNLRATEDRSFQSPEHSGRDARRSRQSLGPGCGHSARRRECDLRGRDQPLPGEASHAAGRPAAVCQ